MKTDIRQNGRIRHFSSARTVYLDFSTIITNLQVTLYINWRMLSRVVGNFVDFGGFGKREGVCRLTNAFLFDRV